MIKHIKRMDNNCHIPDLVQAFSNTYKEHFRLLTKSLIMQTEESSYLTTLEKT